MSMFEDNSRKARVRFFADEKGEFRWHLQGANGEIISGGTEGYRSRQGAEDGLARTGELLFELGYVRVDVHFPTVYPRIYHYLQLAAATGDPEAREILEELGG